MSFNLSDNCKTVNEMISLFNRNGTRFNNAVYGRRIIVIFTSAAAQIRRLPGRRRKEKIIFFIITH